MGMEWDRDDFRDARNLLCMVRRLRVQEERVRGHVMLSLIDQGNVNYHT
jgi:hypothetical protein